MVKFENIYTHTHPGRCDFRIAPSSPVGAISESHRCRLCKKYHRIELNSPKAIKMNEKRRRTFQLEDENGNILATGILYDEGNVQVLWRIDIGYTAEQYASINPIIDLMPGIVVLRLQDARES